MGDTWMNSMNGAPWTRAKMDKAVSLLRSRAIISFVADVDKPEDLQALDTNLFAKRPDLVLSVSSIQANRHEAEQLIRNVADLKHLTALQLNLQQSADLSPLAELEHLQYLSITSKKPVSLSCIASFKKLVYLSLNGNFHDLTAVSKATEIDTLLLSTKLQGLDFVTQLPKLECLFIHDCSLEGSLASLAESSVKILSLASIRGLSQLDDLAGLHNLTSLRLSLPKVESLCDFSKMQKLTQLELDYMKALKNIANLWTADQLEVLVMKEISPAIKAKDLEPLVTLDRLRQIDFQFIDFNKGRIAALREWFAKVKKEQLLYENIAEEDRIKLRSLVRLQKHLGINQ